MTKEILHLARNVKPLKVALSDGGDVEAYGDGGNTQETPMDEHPDQFRELNKLGLYSKAAEVAQGATGQNTTKTPAEWHKYLLNRNVKPDELKWSHFDNAFQPDEKVHKDDVAAHFNYNNQEPYTEQVYKDEGHDYENNEDGIGQLALDMSQDHDLFKKVLPQKHLQEHAKRKEAEGEDAEE